MGSWRELREHLLDVVLPGDCFGCGARGPWLCAGCRALLGSPARPTRPTPAPPGLPPVVAVGGYDGAMRAILLAYKESGAVGLAHPLARSIAAAVPAGAAPALLVPMPSSRTACRRRGDDVVARLARLAARDLRRGGRPARCLPVLRLNRPVADSAGLSAAARSRNLSGAISVNSPRLASAAGRIVLVDDLVTTGATLAEAARVLRAHGRPPASAAVIAATARRHR